MALESSKDCSLQEHVEGYLQGALHNGFSLYLLNLSSQKEGEFIIPQVDTAKAFLRDLKQDGLVCAKELQPKNWFAKLLVPDFVAKTETFHKQMLEMAGTHLFEEKVLETNAFGTEFTVKQHRFASL